MANIVGLSSSQDPINATGQTRLRDSMKLADGLDVVRPTELRPAASPVDTYARPAQAPINHDLENLISGLSSLNSGLQHFSAVQDKNAKKNAKEVDKDAVAVAFAGKSPEEVDQIIKTNPLFQKQVNAQYGGQLQARSQGDADTAWWVNHLNTEFDFQNGDFNKEYDEYVAKRTLQFGTNKGYASSYMEQMAGSKNSLLQSVLKKKAEIAQYGQQQTTQDGMASIIRQAVNTDQSQESLVNDVSNFVRNNKDISKLPYKEQQQYILNGLTPLLNDMDSRPEQRDKIFNAVNTVLTAPRKGEDGVERRLIDAPQGMGEAYQGKLAEFAKKRSELNDRYLTDEKTRFSYNAEYNPTSFTDQQLDEWNTKNNFTYSPAQVQALKLKRAESLKKLSLKREGDEAQEKAQGFKTNITAQNLQRLEGGDFLSPQDREVPTKDFFLSDDHNATEKFTVDAQREAVMEAYGKQLDFAENQQVNEKKLTPDQAKQWRMGQELATYSLNSIVPKAWKQEINDGANQLTTASQQASKEMPQGALQAFERYKLIAAKAPNLLTLVADERARSIFETAMVADGNPTEQLRGALQYYANRDDKREAVTVKKVTEAIDKMAGASWVDRIKGWFGGEVPENLGSLNAEIERRASYLVQAYHMTPDNAVERSVKSIRSHYAIVNGWAVNTNDKRLPADFEKLTERYITDLVKQYGPGKFDAQSARDLTVMSMPDGTFQLFNKRHGYPALEPMPIEWKNGQDKDARFLTADMLQDLSAQDRQKAELRAIRQSADRLKPLFIVPGTSVGIGPVSGGGYSPEEVATINRNIEEQGKPSAEKARQNAEFVRQIDDHAASQRKPVPPREPLPNPFKPSIVLKDSKR
ncbi:hypothetical protein [Methylobacterium sp. J-067]|uniref:hypothetical protein n=1 Tax=Methylobacterium sp. J-067 TaxID=2836648 RepID=UPI001FBAC7B7|nr:hypothetical protein [Methylobacterium sp. J-067]MCJ2025038.1 hypothetical protein [Methylobacterium sp. J-067]